MHALDTHMIEVQAMCAKAGLDRTTTTVSTISLPYDALISLVSKQIYRFWLATDNYDNLRFAALCVSITKFMFVQWFILHILWLLQIEHLKACSEVATSRTINWQRFCQKNDGMFICQVL